MRKTWLLLLALTIFFVTTAPQDADARRGGFRSGKGGFSRVTPSKPSDNVTKTQPKDGNVTSGTKTGTGGAATANRGFFSGGSFMRGLMIGGLAGLLFGGIFGNMGFFGNMLGLLVNLFALYLLFSIGMAVLRYFREKNRPQPNTDRNRYGR